MDILTLNWLVGTGTVLLQVAVVALIVLYIAHDQTMERYIARIAIPVAFAFSVLALVMSLVYSEYFGVVPCALCWFSRAFMYPQVVLFAIAAWKRDANIALYSIALSTVGLAISLYHHILQMNVGALPCPASGGDCAKRIIFEYGYVTFPVVGATLFATFIILMFFVRRASREGVR